MRGNKMKKKDLLWVAALAAIVVFLLYPATHKLFVAATTTHPYIMGFVKVSILATLGELLALRIVAGDWKKPVGLLWKFIVWGFIGMSFVLVFDLFANGVTGSMNKGYLPSIKEKTVWAQLLFAFFTSALMNLIFAPTFMMLHRVTDTFIDLGNGKLGDIFKVKLRDVVNKIDFYGFFSFIVCKTIPIFWIPAHTITFMLPPEYRVLFAALLSVALGGILAYAKKGGAKAAK